MKGLLLSLTRIREVDGAGDGLAAQHPCDILGLSFMGTDVGTANTLTRQTGKDQGHLPPLAFTENSHRLLHTSHWSPVTWSLSFLELYTQGEQEK